MRAKRHIVAAALVLAGAGASGLALAALPPPSPAQAQAAAAKKAAADAQAQKEKAALIASMDALSARWRARAPAQGWPVHPAVAVAAPAAVMTPATGGAPAGQPAGVVTAAAQAAPVRSEKAGTAAPSADVKAAPTGQLPAGAAPTVDRTKR